MREWFSNSRHQGEAPQGIWQVADAIVPKFSNRWDIGILIATDASYLIAGSWALSTPHPESAVICLISASTAFAIGMARRYTIFNRP